MELNYLKDSIFDLLNDNSDEMEITDIETNEKKNTFSLFMADRSKFEIECRKLPDGEV